jgi:hypothetical protein
MKNIICIISFSLFFSSVNSQLLISVFEPNQTVDLNNGNIDVTGLASEFELTKYLWLVNEGAQAITLKCKKTEIDMLAGTENVTCWKICPATYDVAGSNPSAFVTVSGVQMTETLGALDTNKSFSAHYKPMNLDGCSLLKYEWFDENDLSTPLASINIRFIHTTGACGVAINESTLRQSSFQVYPNPANENVSIQIEGSPSQLENTVLKIHDVIGKEVFSVKASSLQSGLLNLETSTFNQGIYLVTLSKEETPIFTKRLIISH